MRRWTVKYGDARIPEGFFFRRSPTNRSHREPYRDGDGAFFRHLSTFPEASTIKAAMLEMLTLARRHIFFCNFLLEDDEVVEALLAAAQRLRGHVYVLTTLKEDDLKSSAEFLTDADESGEGDFQRHRARVEKLSRQGLLIKARSDCHAKFLTIDDEQAIVTSANAVPTCYGNVSKPNGGIREANAENGVWINVIPEVRRLANFFRAIWREGCNYMVAPDRNVFDVQQLRPEPVPIHPCEPRLPTSSGTVLWTAPNDLRLKQCMLDMLHQAQRRVSLSTWVVKGIDQHEIGQALRQTAERGVNIELLARGMNRRDDLRQQCYWLSHAAGSNLTIRGDFWNHSKAVVVDDRDALILTANLDAQHGLDAGVEVGFRSHDPEFVTAVSKFLDRLHGEAAFRFVCDPTQAEVSREQHRDLPLPSRWIVRNNNPSAIRIREFENWMDSIPRELIVVATSNANDFSLRSSRGTLVMRQTSHDEFAALRIESLPKGRRVALPFSGYLCPCEIIAEC